MFALIAPALPARAQTVTLQTILADRGAAMKLMHAHAPHSLQIMGTLHGAGLQGTFHSWTGERGQRYDQQIGSRLQTTIRTEAGRQFAVDENGNVRELRGLLQQRQRTDDFIDEEQFATQTQYDRYLGPVHLPDGRDAYAVQVLPPGGLPEEVDLDKISSMIDRISYDDADGRSTSDYYNYNTFKGAVVAQREVDSNGDAEFDIERSAVHIVVDRAIDPSTFAVPKNNEIRTAAPVTVPLIEHDGHFYTHVQIHGNTYLFLVDTGAQAIVIDARLSGKIGLHPEGHLEVSGAQRVGGLGIADLDSIQIGSATLPLHSVSVLDLSNVTGTFQADGVLGYPFFASAEVQFDAAANQMTFGRPGTLHASGNPFGLDVDRALIEVDARVNGVGGRFVLDTGNSGELLLFAPFMKTHPHLLPVELHPMASNYGVGGSVEAVFAYVDELDMSSFRFFNRYSNLMLAQRGAFADRFDAGNIGMGILRNLVVTFDVANAQAFAQQSRTFDDGRYRARKDSIIP